VVGIGDTLEEAHSKAAEIAKAVKGYSLTIPAEDVLKDAEAEIEKASEMGLEVL
jgi:hypothetical protein